MAAPSVYARAVAILCAQLTVPGPIPATSKTFSLVPIYVDDIWLHAGLAPVAVYLGFVHGLRALAEHERTLDKLTSARPFILASIV